MHVGQVSGAGGLLRPICLIEGTPANAGSRKQS
jgi:hypothetical protein